MCNGPIALQTSQRSIKPQNERCGPAGAAGCRRSEQKQCFSGRAASLPCNAFTFILFSTFVLCVTVSWHRACRLRSTGAVYEQRSGIRCSRITVDQAVHQPRSGSFHTESVFGLSCWHVTGSPSEHSPCEPCCSNVGVQVLPAATVAASTWLKGSSNVIQPSFHTSTHSWQATAPTTAGGEAVTK